MDEINQILLDFTSRLRELKEKRNFVSERVRLDSNEFDIKNPNLIKKIDKILNWISTEIPTNILNEKKAKQSLKKSEARAISKKKKKEDANKIYPILFKNASDIISVQNDRLEYEYFNRKVVKKILGYSKSDLLGKTSLELIHPDDRKRTIIASSKILRKGKGIHEVRFKCKNGGYKWLEVTGRNFFNNKGEMKTLTILRDVSERKEMEQKLIESEEKYRHLFEKSPNMIILIDSSGKIVQFNHAFLNLFGYDKRDLIDKDFLQLKGIFPQNLTFFEIKFKEMIERGCVESFEFQAYDKEKRLKWMNLQASLLEIEGKSLIQIILRDISEHREAEQKLKNSETKYRNLFERTPFSIILIDSEGKIVDCNPSTIALTGHQKEEIINEKFVDLPLIVSEYKPLIFKRFLKVLEGEQLPSLDIQLQKKDGSLIWINYISSLVKVGDKTMLQAIVNDITEKKKIEQELINSEKKFRKMFEIIPDFFFLVSTDTEVLDFSGKTEDFSLPPTTFLRKKLTDILPDESKLLIENAVKKTIESQEPTVVEFSLLLNNITRYFEARHLYFSEDRVAIFLRDISERKRAEDLAKEELQKLRELEKIRLNLITRISHELKTPLVSICGGAEMLVNVFKDKFDKETLEMIELIEKGGKRLRNLVENLLDASRLENEKFALKKELNDLSEIVKNCSEEMSFWTKERGIALDLKLPDKLYLEIDRTRIEQVIVNLLSNAIKNTPPRGKIKVSLKKANDHAKISVTDTGVGLNEEEMDKIFERFGKIERQGPGFEYLDVQGAGLGLFLSKEIVNMHGGQIWAASRGRNSGSTFTVKLPMNRSSQSYFRYYFQ